MQIPQTQDLDSQKIENGNFHTFLQNFKVPDDYKFHCFGDEIFVQVDTDRFINHTRTIFDAQWQKMPFEILYNNPNYIPKKPKNFEIMSNIARVLGHIFGGVRVDLYNLDGVIKTGEITFTHGGGTERFIPNEWDAKLGSLWHMGINSGL